MGKGILTYVEKDRVFNEKIFYEHVYGEQKYHDEVAAGHEQAVHYVHTSLYDGQYFPVSGVPQDYTYGRTVYIKGADMVHTLRSYMGDSRGRWEGRLVADLEREEPEAWAEWRRAGAGYRFPGGESLEEHQERALAALDAVRAGPLPALVVCHGGTIRVILAARRPEGLDAFHDPERIPNATVIRLDDGRWTNAA